jgi:hypothetical protein
MTDLDQPRGGDHTIPLPSAVKKVPLTVDPTDVGAYAGVNEPGSEFAAAIAVIAER